MKFSIKDFFSKCDLIRRKLWIWSHLLKKSLMENFIFLCSDTRGIAVLRIPQKSFRKIPLPYFAVNISPYLHPKLYYLKVLHQNYFFIAALNRTVYQKNVQNLNLWGINLKHEFQD